MFGIALLLTCVVWFVASLLDLVLIMAEMFTKICWGCDLYAVLFVLG